MARVVAINILLILAPFILYAAYVLIEKKPESREDFWKLIPAKPLFAVGLLLMSIFYITQINFNSGKDGVYHPAEVRDGKIIPGYISRPDNPAKTDDKAAGTPGVITPQTGDDTPPTPT